MGACTFSDAGPKGETDVNKAYRAAREDATYMHGHDGYNGTISTTSGVVVVQGLLTPVTRDKVHAITEPILDGDDDRYRIDKWGNAGAIAVADDQGTFSHWYFFGWAAE